MTFLIYQSHSSAVTRNFITFIVFSCKYLKINRLSSGHLSCYLIQQFLICTSFRNNSKTRFLCCFRECIFNSFPYTDCFSLIYTFQILAVKFCYDIIINIYCIFLVTVLSQKLWSLSSINNGLAHKFGKKILIGKDILLDRTIPLCFSFDMHKFTDLHFNAHIFFQPLNIFVARQYGATLSVKCIFFIIILLGVIIYN